MLVSQINVVNLNQKGRPWILAFGPIADPWKSFQSAAPLADLALGNFPLSGLFVGRRHRPQAVGILLRRRAFTARFVEARQSFKNIAVVGMGSERFF